jgi:hypothetical protein
MAGSGRLSGIARAGLWRDDARTIRGGAVMIEALGGSNQVTIHQAAAGAPAAPLAADSLRFAQAIQISVAASQLAGTGPAKATIGATPGDQILKTVGLMSAPVAGSPPSLAANLPYGGIFYGNAVAADAIYPVKITYGRDADFRFRAERSGSVDSIQVNNRVNRSGESTYSTATGGRVMIELRADDGTAQHLPSSTVLARSESYVPSEAGDYPELAFDHPVTLQAGQIYHYVMVQLEPGQIASSNANFVANAGGVADNPYFGDVFNVFYGNGSSWQIKRGSSDAPNGQLIPAFELGYTDGVSVGAGMMAQKSATDAVGIGGGALARQIFEVDGADKHVTGLWLRPARISNDGAPLEVTLKDGSGRIAWQGEIPADQISRTGGTDPRSAYMNGPVGWVYARFPETVTLESGQTYAVELGSSGKYSIAATTDLSGKMQDRNAWDSGFAQVSTDGGQSWTGWTKTFGSKETGFLSSHGGATNQDLPILFTLDGMPDRLPRLSADYGSWDGTTVDTTVEDTTLGVWPQDLVEFIKGPLLAQLQLAISMLQDSTK